MSEELSDSDPFAGVKSLVDIIKGSVAIAAVVGGGIFGLIEYYSKQSDDRVKQTLTLVERFHKAPVSDAYSRVSSVWFANETKLAEVAADEEKWRAFTLKVIADNRLEDHLLTTIDFFRELKICVDRKICDEEVARAFFQVEARSFYNTNFPYISEKRRVRKDKSFAGDLRQFVGAPE